MVYFGFYHFATATQALRRDYHYSSNTPEKHKIQTNVEASNWSWAWGKQTILQGHPEWMSKVKQFQTVCTGVVSLECSWMRNTGKFILWNIQNRFSLGHWVSDHLVTRMFNRLQNAFRLWKAACSYGCPRVTVRNHSLWKLTPVQTVLLLTLTLDDPVHMCRWNMYSCMLRMWNNNAWGNLKEGECMQQLPSAC